MKTKLTMLESVRAELAIIRDVIVSMVPVEAIYLFGSYAYGEPHSGSDLDIYVVLPDGELDTIDICTKIRQALYKKKTIPMDLLISKKTAFNNKKDKTTLENLIVKNGIKIYGN
jgi:predicted nucleotidyltransferase